MIHADPSFTDWHGPEAAAALVELFEELPEVLFWIKDGLHRVRVLNTTFAERVNRDPADIIGLGDLDLYYPEMARVFLADDRMVLETGTALRKKVELLATRFGTVEWRSTTKLPLRDRRGGIVGTTGISRPIGAIAESLPAPYRAFASMIEYARAELAHGVDIRSIARHAGMSVATLGRRFREHLRISPGEFLSQLRISRACELLRSTALNVTEIAAECGYESPAAFSRAFRRQMQVSPSQFRG